MLNEYQKEVHRERIARTLKEPIQSGTLNDFDGTFQITDIKKVPEQLIPYLSAKFKLVDAGRGHPLRSVTPDQINEALNEIWEGRGSLAKVQNATYHLLNGTSDMSEFVDKFKSTLE